MPRRIAYEPQALGGAAALAWTWVLAGLLTGVFVPEARYRPARVGLTWLIAAPSAQGIKFLAGWSSSWGQAASALTDDGRGCPLLPLRTSAWPLPEGPGRPRECRHSLSEAPPKGATIPGLDALRCLREARVPACNHQELWRRKL